MAIRLAVLALFLGNAILVFAIDQDAQRANVIPHDNSLAFPGKSVFDFQKYGWKIDVRVVPGVNASNAYRNQDDRFPDFPFKEIGGCILDLSLICVQNRIARYVDDIDHLDEFTLFDQTIKVVRAKPSESSQVSERQLISDSVSDRIDRSVNHFFDTHALRVTLPKLNGKLSQVNIMYDDALLEGRGKKGGKGGGKCKKMMMMMFGMMKMKLMGMVGLTAMKGMMMAGMSLMLSKMMLIMKLMSLKKGGGFGGGGGGGSKEVIWVTKQSGGGGSGCCGGGGGSPPIDSYGAPPPTSYGAPSSGGGGYDYSGGGGGGGGSGWGRSFEKQSVNQDYDYPDSDDRTGQRQLNGQSLNLTRYEISNKWFGNKNLTNAWNNTAPLLAMTYFTKPIIGKEGNAVTNEEFVSRVENEESNSNNHTMVPHYRKLDIKKYNTDHIAKIRSILLHRNASVEINSKKNRTNILK